MRPPAPTFAASFTLVTGNEWWIQTQVTPSGGDVQSVDVRVNGGARKPLAKQSWGVREWAASYHAPDGTIVQFQAASTTSATVASSCYRWVPPQGGGQAAPVVSCTDPPPPPPAAFTADFTNVKGNNWWAPTRGGSTAWAPHRWNFVAGLSPPRRRFRRVGPNPTPPRIPDDGMSKPSRPTLPSGRRSPPAGR